MCPGQVLLQAGPASLSEEDRAGRARANPACRFEGLSEVKGRCGEAASSPFLFVIVLQEHWPYAHAGGKPRAPSQPRQAIKAGRRFRSSGNPRQRPTTPCPAHGGHPATSSPQHQPLQMAVRPYVL